MKLPGSLRWFSLLLGISTLLAGRPRAIAADGDTLVYIGTYTGGKSKGIYVSRFDQKTGALSTPVLAAESPSPSFLALHGNKKVLYAANEMNKFEDQPGGAVSAFEINRDTGKLTLLNQLSAGGAGPCHVAIDSTGQCLMVANYGGGNLAAFTLEKTGALKERSTLIQHAGSSVNPQRQKEPHAHHVTPDPSNRFALACDLGLDKVMIYRLDPPRGKLTANNPAHGSLAPGAGPRHLAFHPSKPFCYVINEISCTVTTFAFDRASGAMETLQTISTLPGAVEKGFSTAEIVMHPSGKFVYGSNRGHDSVVVYAIDSETGHLTLVQHQTTLGKTPRNFGIDPTGDWLLAANQGSDTIVVFKIDKSTGRLTAANQTASAPNPVCVVFLPN